MVNETVLFVPPLPTSVASVKFSAGGKSRDTEDRRRVGETGRNKKIESLSHWYKLERHREMGWWTSYQPKHLSSESENKTLSR